jgi:PHP family Zn ribbon phosphoesterase
MTELEIVCDNCDSQFTLSFNENDVSYHPTNCPFCGDFVSGGEQDDIEDLDFESESDIDNLLESDEELDGSDRD